MKMKKQEFHFKHSQTGWFRSIFLLREIRKPGQIIQYILNSSGRRKITREFNPPFRAAFPSDVSNEFKADTKIFRN